MIVCERGHLVIVSLQVLMKSDANSISNPIEDGSRILHWQKYSSESELYCRLGASRCELPVYSHLMSSV